jgi:hypothetical protein
MYIAENGDVFDDEEFIITSNNELKDEDYLHYDNVEDIISLWENKFKL